MKNQYCESYHYGNAGQRTLKITPVPEGGRLRRHLVRYLPSTEIRCRGISNHIDCWQIIHVGSVQLCWSRSGNYQLHYAMSGNKANRLLELDHSGRPIGLETYYPYGGTASWATDHRIYGLRKVWRFGSKERDESGLYYFGFRYYAPWLLRWLNPDPAGTLDGLNLLRMCRNNPATWQDGDGRMVGESEYQPDSPLLEGEFVDPVPLFNELAENGNHPMDDLEIPLIASSCTPGMNDQIAARDEVKIQPGNIQGEENCQIAPYQRPYKCDTCGVRFVEKLMRECHIAIVHLQPGDGKTCDLCNKTFASTSNAVNHRLTHLETKLFNCDVAECGQSFSHRIGLREHVKKYHSSNPLKCPDCDQRFLKPESLKRHIKKLHKPDNKFPCDYCTKRFKTSSRKLQHERQMHFDDRDFHCGLNNCKLRFASEEVLHRHWLNKHQYRPPQ